MLKHVPIAGSSSSSLSNCTWTSIVTTHSGVQWKKLGEYLSFQFETTTKFRISDFRLLATAQPLVLVFESNWMRFDWVFTSWCCCDNAYNINNTRTMLSHPYWCTVPFNFNRNYMGIVSHSIRLIRDEKMFFSHRLLCEKWETERVFQNGFCACFPCWSHRYSALLWNMFGAVLKA